MSDQRGTVHSIQFLRFVAATLVVVFGLVANGFPIFTTTLATRTVAAQL